ncbi:hypothetical protein V5799_014514 [Amblyomma americanum]|uniref:Uncharacterized protein n=1 Tax=Amblyomma americanum TaxID=6943 RepID=A0AAQ4E2T7_AMBAM
MDEHCGSRTVFSDFPRTTALPKTDTPWSMQHGLLHSLHSAGLRHIHQTGDHSKHILHKFCDRGNSVSHGRTFDN